MSSLSSELARFTLDLRFDQIPAGVVAKARDSIVDTVGVCAFGATLPWSRMVVDYARATGAGGNSTIIGTPHRVAAPLAALANGASAHGFEMDNLRQPSAGVHAGSTVVPALLAIGEEVEASGRDVLTAFVAAYEVMGRIGDAAGNSAETLGFHSPGLTGTFGAALAAAKLLGLTHEQTVNAMGVAGSLCSGLLAFAKAGNGGMVKRLHTGRAAEGGILAAKLAASGFTGPDAILEGRFGFFEAFTREPRLEKLLAGLGQEWETARIAIKCYPFHVTAHTPVQALEDLRAKSPFGPEDILEIHIATSKKVLSHHNIVRADDIATAQYSLPFCFATAICRNPNDPASFLADPHRDPKIIELVGRINLSLNERSIAPEAAWATKLRIILKDGRVLETARDDFLGTPSCPMSVGDLKAKFDRLTDNLDDRDALFDRMYAMDRMPVLNLSD